MAIWKSSLYTSQVPGAGASQAVGYGLSKVSRGKLRIAEVALKLAGTEAANDLIYLTLQYPGERLLPNMSKITCQNPGTTLTMKIGDSVTSDRYCGAIALGGSAQDVFLSGTPGASSGAATYAPSDITVPAYSSANPPQPIPPTTTVDQTIVVATITAAGTVTANALVLITLAFVAND